MLTVGIRARWLQIGYKSVTRRLCPEPNISRMEQRDCCEMQMEGTAMETLSTWLMATATGTFVYVAYRCLFRFAR